jgi:plastocyanin
MGPIASSALVAGALMVDALLGPSVARAAITVPAKIVEPSPSNFQTWAFNPTTLTIHVGNNVTWTNTGQANHTVTANDASFDSGNVAAGATFSFVFSKAGTFDYKCTYHPWMKGTIDVLSPGQVAPSTPTPVLSAATPFPAPTVPLPAPTPVLPTATAVPAATAVSPPSPSPATNVLLPTQTGITSTPTPNST